VVKNRDCINLKEEIILEQNNPVNNSVYTTQGNFLGKVVDVAIDDKQNVEFLELDNQTKILTKQIAVSGVDAIIVQDNQKLVRISNFKKRGMPNKNLVSTVQEVKIMPTDVLPTLTNDQKVSIQQIPNGIKYPFNSKSLPIKISSSNFKFLIGRKAERTIYADNQELIIKKNNKITNRTVEIAKVHGKLRELTMFSL
jgi:sporulation protein YlmC with PRC-barrel domain